jgi:hypothetical protein
VGGRLVVHGQGMLERQVRGVLEVDGVPGVVAIAVRRYECQRCGAVMTVVPSGMLARRQYSASSIALALHLWLVVGLPDRQVHQRVGAWQVRGRCGRGWAQLYRWARLLSPALFHRLRVTLYRDSTGAKSRIAGPSSTWVSGDGKRAAGPPRMCA